MDAIIGIICCWMAYRGFRWAGGLVHDGLAARGLVIPRVINQDQQQYAQQHHRQRGLQVMQGGRGLKNPNAEDPDACPTCGRPY